MTDLISRQAAIKAIDDLPNCYNGYSDTYDKAYIIGVLEEVPPAEQKKVVEDYCRPRNLMVVAAEDFHRFDVPDRKVGKWMHDADGHVWCYECGFGKERSDERPYRYCPNCGARMENGDE